jgi:hypothetical protein
MHLPHDLVLQSIDNWCITYFKDTTHHKDAPPHFYITIPINESICFIVCIITSQIDKRVSYYSNINKAALDSLILVDNKELSFLSKKCIVDCNKAELVTKEELKKRIVYVTGIEVKRRDLSDDFKGHIKKAITGSPLIAQRVKKLLAKFY